MKHPLAEEIQWERHRLFMAEVGSRMVGSVIIAAIVGAMFAGTVPRSSSLIWFSGIAFVGLNSWVFVGWHRRSEKRASGLKYARLWHWINLYLSVIWGIFWALVPYLFFPDATQVQILSLLLLVVVASSMPSVTMGCYPDIYITFLTPVFFSFSWHLMSVDFGGEILPLIIAPLTWMMLVLFSIVIHRTHMESIILRLEHRKAQELADERTSAKTRFIAVASHDLRQPIQAARLYAEAMLSDSRMLTESTATKLSRSLTSASGLLDRLLDISKMDAGVMPVNKQSISVRQVVEEMSAIHSAHAAEKGIALTFSCDDVYVSADHNILIEILDNILSNAVRYTSDGEIKISTDVQSGEVCIIIRDTGCGIPSDRLALVFEEFYQVADGGGTTGATGKTGATCNSVKGMGLGLPIVKRLSQLHNMRYELNSEAGKGTEFRAYLPSALKPVPAQESQQPLPASEPLRILIVDDEPEITDALSLTLVSHGHDVWAANSLEEVEGVLIRSGVQPDLLITDDRLPYGNRSDDVLRIVYQHCSDNTPVIIMTGNTSPDRIKSLQTSGIPILFKPVGSDALLRLIADISDKLSTADA
ncbi:MAG: signal transduction histidine kinase [Thalassolituus sp.]|jgi:signal transduction histidine kinase